MNKNGEIIVIEDDVLQQPGIEPFLILSDIKSTQIKWF